MNRYYLERNLDAGGAYILDHLRDKECYFAYFPDIHVAYTILGILNKLEEEGYGLSMWNRDNHATN